MRLNRRGQMGPIGEDWLYYTLMFILLSFFMMLALSTFADFEARYAALDTFRLGQAYADKAAMALASHYKDDETAKLGRVLDNDLVGKKLTGGACTGICDKCSICVINSRTGEKRFCGQKNCDENINPSFVATSINLPISLKIDEKKYQPGMLKVSLIR